MKLTEMETGNTKKSKEPKTEELMDKVNESNVPPLLDLTHEFP